MAIWSQRASGSMATTTVIAHYPPDRSGRRRWTGWTWADEEREIRTRECLCCGKPGHYQEMLEAHIAEHGMDGLAIYIRNGRVRDGHHRVVAAARLGIEQLPLETKANVKARWVRDHGYVDWEHRAFGDRMP